MTNKTNNDDSSSGPSLPRVLGIQENASAVQERFHALLDSLAARAAQDSRLEIERRCLGSARLTGVNVSYLKLAYGSADCTVYFHTCYQTSGAVEDGNGNIYKREYFKLSMSWDTYGAVDRAKAVDMAGCISQALRVHDELLDVLKDGLVTLERPAQRG